MHFNPRVADALALVAGACLPLGFAPFELSPIAILAPAALFLLWLEADAARAARRGFLFGLGMFGVGVSWVYVSMHNFGNMAAPLAAFATLLLVAGLALYPALLGFVQARMRGSNDVVHIALVLPALWTLFEWWRGWFLTGFPWLNLGYSQAGTWLAGYAPWLGVYGVSLFAAVSAGLIALAVHERHRWLPVAAMFAAVWALGWAVGKVDWSQPAGEPLRVALVQGNTPLARKWRPEERPRIIERYLALSDAARDARLIVWPEAAAPGYLHQLETLIATLETRSRERGADFVFGAIEGNARTYYNSVAAVGATPGVYRKRHLVPFGEFLPLPYLFGWIIDSMQIPMSNFTAGDADKPLLTAAGQALGVSVCYEDAFGEEVIRALPEATMLVNLSEDAWFGDSLAPHQRVQMARLRALETARPMLRAANTGPSVAIDHRGRVLARSAQFVPTVLDAEVQPMSGRTPYVLWGNWTVVSSLALLLFLALAVPRWRVARR
jgi:apolipoprotein N-acyltransferase